MLTGLKVSSLACECVFYRPEPNGKGIELCRSLKVEMKYTDG